MSEISANNKRIAKNTLLLYFRMLFIMVIQLYTSRVVLNTLGVVDYGIYNVVGGVVSMFSFLNAAMTASSQRYLTFELGRGDMKSLKKVFVTCIHVHAIIALLVIVLAESVGLWFLLEKMVIPLERVNAALWVYQLSVLTMVVAIMSYPYNAAIIAHEKMSAFAYISIIEVVLKLLIVFCLLVGDFDKLILYAVLVMLVQLFIQCCYLLYCSNYFQETKYKYQNDSGLLREMLGFAGWNLWGNLAAILFGQGLNLLLNMFFGPVVNAARAVSVQVQGAIHQLSSNFQMALNPQITKTYAAGQLKEMHKLIFRSSKFTFFLLMIICVPVLLETPIILKLWLKNVPEHTVTFLRLMTLTMMVDSTANPLMVSAAATGKVRTYQTVIGGILLTIVPISYVVLRLGGAPWSVFLVHLAVCCVAFVSRLFIVRPLIQLHIEEYFQQVIIRCSFVFFLTMLITCCAYHYLPDTFLAVFIVCSVGIISGSLLSFTIGLDAHEREVVGQKIRLIKFGASV